MINPELILTLLNVLVVYAESIISLRILLKLLGASTTAPFVRWVFQSSNPLLYPFEGMFPSSRVNGIPFTLEFSAIFALFAYIFVGYLLQEIIDFVSRNFSKKKRRQKIIDREDEESE